MWTDSYSWEVVPTLYIIVYQTTALFPLSIIYPHHFVTRKEYTNTTEKSFIKTTVRFLKNHRQKKQRHQQIMSKNQTVAKHEHSLSKWNVKFFFKNCVYMFTQVTDKNI